MKNGQCLDETSQDQAVGMGHAMTCHDLPRREGVTGSICQGFVLSSFVSNFMMAMIVFNAVLLGVEIEMSARMGQNDIPSWFGIATGMGWEGGCQVRR